MRKFDTRVKQTKVLKIVGDIVFVIFFIAYILMTIMECLFGVIEYSVIFKAVAAGFELFGICLEISAWRIEGKEKAESGNEYTIEQIIDAITQADEEIMQAIRRKDRGMLEVLLEDYL
ncbi:MAG: hypothetical protein NC118_10920 [Eubacterium sp.]|nr:hypothetical protein [Eubacterium sp.]